MEQRIVTKTSFYTNIMLLSIPIILQQFLRVSVDLCDSIMLGRIDQVQMAAVSQAQQIFFVFYTVCNGFAVGCSVLIAQYWGLQRKEEIKTLFAIGSKIIAVFAIIISAIVLIRPDQVMRIYSSDPEVIALGASYLRIAAWMYTPCAVSSMLFACCRGIEQMKISFAVNAVSYPINLILDYCMIFGKFGFPELGIQGSAVGAVIARLIEFGILLWFIIRKEKTLQMRLKDFLRKDWKLTKDFLKVGIPIVAHEMIWSAGTTAGSSITGQMSTFHYDMIDQIEGAVKMPAMETFPTMIVAVSSGAIDGYVADRPGAVSATSANPDLTYVTFDEGQGFTVSPDDAQIAVGVRQGSELKEQINEILAGISAEERNDIMDAVVLAQPLSE